MSKQDMSDAMQALEVLLVTLDTTRLTQVDADEASAAGADLLMYVRQAYAREAYLAVRLDEAVALLWKFAATTRMSGAHWDETRKFLAAIDAESAGGEDGTK